MFHEIHRCSADGDPNRAEYGVFLHDETQGAVLFGEDESWPFICVEHAIGNERSAIGERCLHAVGHRYTNRPRAAALCVYHQQEPGYVA